MRARASTSHSSLLSSLRMAAQGKKRDPAAVAKGVAKRKTNKTDASVRQKAFLKATKGVEYYLNAVVNGQRWAGLMSTVDAALINSLRKAAGLKAIAKYGFSTTKKCTDFVRKLMAAPVGSLPAGWRIRAL